MAKVVLREKQDVLSKNQCLGLIRYHNDQIKANPLLVVHCTYCNVHFAGINISKTMQHYINLSNYTI